MVRGVRRTTLAAVAGAAVAAGLGAHAAEAPPTRSVIHLAWAPGRQLALDAATPTWTDARRLLVLRGGGFTMFGPEVNDGIEWSPRGDLIAIGGFGLYVIRPDGTGLRRLAGNTAGLGSWSPDGTRLLFVSGDGYLYVIGRDGRGAHRLALINNNFDAHAVWSPDGRRVAFQACRPGRDPDVCDSQVLDLFVVGADGKALRRITHRSMGDQCRLSWAPARDIVYGNDAGATVIATPAGKVRRTIPGFTCATWSPNGTQLLGWARGVPAIARADAGSPKAVVHYHDRTVIGAGPPAPVWSPDGTQIAFDRVYLRNGNPLSRDYIADLRSDHVRRLP